MINNEKGFVLPSTLIIVTIVLFFFVGQINILMLERKYYREVEGVMTLDYLMEMAVYQVKQDILSGTTGDREFTMRLQEGTAEVQINAEKSGFVYDENEEIIFHVIILCVTNFQQKYQVSFTFNPRTNTISDWTEG